MALLSALFRLFPTALGVQFRVTPRFYFRTLMVLVAVIIVLDIIRFDPAKASLMLVGALIPALYFVVFLLGPVYSNLHNPRPVPERLTVK